LKLCKRLLRVTVNTCTAAVYGELGRYPLYIQRYVKLIQYWFKIMDSDNIILRTIYNAALGGCIKDARSVSFYPYNRSQILQYVEYTK